MPSALKLVPGVTLFQSETWVPADQILWKGASKAGVQGVPDIFGLVMRAFRSAERIRQDKRDQSWRSFLAQRGIALRGTPIRTHHPKAFLARSSEDGTWIIFYDNSVPVSVQQTSIAHEYAHLLLQHEPSESFRMKHLQELEAELVAALLTSSGDPSNYLRENPEVLGPLFVAGVSGLGYAICRVLDWIYETRKD